MRRLAAACLTGAILLTGCANTGASDPLQVTDTLVAATPATSPPTGTPPAGTVLPAPAAELTAYEPATRTLATTHGRTLNLFDTRNLRQPPRTVELPTPPASLHPTGDGQLLAALPDSNLVTHIDPRTATSHPTPVAGGPTDATPTGDHLAVTLRDTKTVAFLDARGHPANTATGFQDPAQLVALGNQIHVLDRLTTALTPLDPATAEKGAGLRAGDGATHAITDRFGRILVVDTRGNELLAFTAEPLIMKQRYPVPGTPYGLAYDPARDLVWITLTQTNEVVAYNIAGGEPQERHRIPTVAQPNSISVNPETGEVYIASANGQGLQVVKV